MLFRSAAEIYKWYGGHVTGNTVVHGQKRREFAPVERKAWLLAGWRKEEGQERYGL